MTWNRSAQLLCSPDLRLLPSSPDPQAVVVAEPAPRLSVVIVNYRQWPETAALTRQILVTPEARRNAVEVVIIDNHSPADPLIPRLRRWPGVSLRRWKRNRGFARAVNEGVRLSRGEWCLLLNPDMTLGEGFLEGVVKLMDNLMARDPKPGIIGFHLRNTNGTLQQSSGPFPTLSGTLLRLLKPRARRKYLAPRIDQGSSVPWVTGCCLLVHRTCLEQLGGLDEAFFLYYEDVDLCRRARERGWSVRYEPALHAFHHRPLHNRAVSPFLRLCTRHALLVYSWKHWPRWQFRLLTGIVRLEAGVREWWARRKGEGDKAATFRQLAKLARLISRGGPAAARRRLNRVINREEWKTKVSGPVYKKADVRPLASFAPSEKSKEPIP